VVTAQRIHQPPGLQRVRGKEIVAAVDGFLVRRLRRDLGTVHIADVSP
jgi:hypothetical protein